MRITRSILMLLVLTGIAVSGYAADEPKDNAGMPEMGPPKEMKEMDFMVGSWKYEGQMKMDPNGEWIPNVADAEWKYVAGGASLQMTYTSMMMGMEFQGHSLVSYDRELGEWQDVWVDNFSGRISMYTGDFKDGAFVVSGKDIWDGKTALSRATTYDITDTSFKWKMENSYDNGESWFISMQGTYTKK